MQTIVVYFDDDESNLDVLDGFFKNSPDLQPYCLIIANGDSNWQSVIQAYEPQIVIIDIDMPIHGFVITETIRENPAWHNKILIAHTATSIKTVETYKIYFDGLIAKPTRAKEFIAGFQSIVAAGRTGKHDVWQTV